MGGIWFPEHLSLLCSGRCPGTTHLGLFLPRRARGAGSFVSLMETRRHGPGLPKCHCTPLFTQLNPTHSEPLHSIQRLRESFLMSFLGVFLDSKLRFYLFFCVIRAFPAGRILNANLVVQLTAEMQPARGERNIFQAIP